MTKKNIDMMKKLIEEKKKKSAQQGSLSRHDKNIGEKRAGIKKFKKGGLFDK